MREGKIATGMTDILGSEKLDVASDEVTGAIFYSINATKRGLRGVEFGSRLITRAVKELKEEFGGISDFVTLSPLPGFRKWVNEQEGGAKVEGEGGELEYERLDKFADKYLASKDKSGKPVNSVARFHMGNGAKILQINRNGDMSKRGMDSSFGYMVNYRYEM